MKKIICARCEEEKEHYALGLCKKCYRWKRLHSEGKICEGCEIKRVTDNAQLCKSCIQLGIRGKLVKRIRTGSGRELYLKWVDGKWKLLHPSLYEAEQIRKDLLSQLAIIHEKT